MAYDKTESDPLIIPDDDNNKSNNMSPFDRNSNRDGGGFMGIFICLSVVGGIMLLTVLLTGFVVVPPGQIAVVVTLGHISVLEPGSHVRTPFVSYVEMLSTQTQLLDQENVIPTQEGLSVKLETAVLFRLDTTKAGELFRTVGKNYRSVVVEPETASAIRGLTSESDAKALYTSGRAAIQEAVKADLQKVLAPRGILVEDVLLKQVVLPQQLSESIELKAKAEQDAARMEFVLQQARQEAERKAIEAKGIADFQNIVSAGISPELLKWKGIEATEKMAESPNAKIVIMGNTEAGLPVLFSDSTFSTDKIATGS